MSPDPLLQTNPRSTPPLPGAFHPVRVIAVTGGKGGVGKTNVSVNLAVSLAEMGKRTLLMDADLGLANVDVLLEGPEGLIVVPASSGFRHMAELTPAEHVGLVHVFSELQRALDVMVVDTAAGITDSVLTFCQAAQDTVVVVCDEPASITDAYALIKVLARERGLDRVHVIANMVRDPNEGRKLYEKLARVCERFLGDVALHYLGAVPQDDWLRRAVQRQQAVVKAYPGSPSARAIAEIARTTARWQPPVGARGNVEFFVERLIQRGVAA